MRIGLLTLDWPPRGGGMARFCVETARALARRGHALIALTGRDGASGDAGIRVVPALSGDLSTDDAVLRAHDAQVDLWHGWEFGFGGLAKHSARPTVVTVHGNDLYRPQAFYRFTRTPLLHRLAGLMRRPVGQRRMCRRSLRRVARFLPNSRHTEEILHALYPMCRRSEVVHCGVGDRFFQEHGKTDGPPRLLTVCSLSRVRPRKNVVGVLHALAMLGGDFDLFYDVCGAGDMLAELRALAATLGLNEKVQFHGGVGDEQLRSLYRRADLFVLAPHARAGDVEGFGIAYLEANAAGTPVLAARTGGIPDAVQDGVSGFFTASPAPQHIAAALRRFLGGQIRFDPNRVRAWAESHRYSAVVDKLEAVYRSVLRGHD